MGKAREMRQQPPLSALGFVLSVARKFLKQLRQDAASLSEMNILNLFAWILALLLASLFVQEFMCVNESSSLRSERSCAHMPEAIGHVVLIGTGLRVSAEPPTFLGAVTSCGVLK